MNILIRSLFFLIVGLLPLTAAERPYEMYYGVIKEDGKEIVPTRKVSVLHHLEGGSSGPPRDPNHAAVNSDYDGNLRFFVCKRLKDQSDAGKGWVNIGMMVVADNPEDPKKQLGFSITSQMWEDGSWEKGVTATGNPRYRLMLSKKLIVEDDVGKSAYDKR